MGLVQTMVGLSFPVGPPKPAASPTTSPPSKLTAVPLRHFAGYNLQVVGALGLFDR